MATQIFGRDHIIPKRRASERTNEAEAGESRIGALRGLLFAMLFNVLLAMAGVIIWQLLELLR